MADDFSAVMNEVQDANVDQVSDAGNSGEGTADLPAIKMETEDSSSEAKTDWRKVPAELKEFFKTPQGKQAADAWFARAGWHEKFPGGTKEADEILGFLNEHGGREGLSTALSDLQTKAQELDAIQERLANADSSLISDLPRESIGKLAPAFLAEYAKADPESYNRDLSSVFASTIAQSGIPLELQTADFNFNMLRNVIEKAGISDNPLYPMIVEAFNNLYNGHGKIKEFASGFAKVANTAVTPKIDAAKVSGAQQELDQLKEQTFKTEFSNKVDAFRAPVIAEELKAFIAKAPNDPDKRELAMNQVRSQVIERLAKDTAYQKDLNAFYRRRDLAGAMKLVESRERKAIIDIAPKVGRIIYGSVEAKAATAATKKEPTVTKSTTNNGAYKKPSDVWDEAFA